MKHKWHKEIKAWADGAEIEAKHCNADNWYTEDEPYFWQDDFEFRIKPQTKEPQYLYVYKTENGIEIIKEGMAVKVNILTDRFDYLGKIKLENEE
jgi:hypothetical protein